MSVCTNRQRLASVWEDIVTLALFLTVYNWSVFCLQLLNFAQRFMQIQSFAACFQIIWLKVMTQKSYCPELKNVFKAFNQRMFIVYKPINFLHQTEKISYHKFDVTTKVSIDDYLSPLKTRETAAAVSGPPS